MKRIARLLRRHFGASYRSVAVRTAIPWYGRLLIVFLLVLLGYFIGYARYSGDGVAQLRDRISQLSEENRNLRTQSIHVESQKQVTQVTQNDLAKDMAALQEENGKLKEDVEFYKSILEGGSSVGVVKLHSFKISKSIRPGEYDFRLLLIQSGKHDKSVQGSLQLLLTGIQDGKEISIPVNSDAGGRGFKINFKYYQPVEGSFSIPAQASISSVQAKLFTLGSSEPKLTQSVQLPQ